MKRFFIAIILIFVSLSTYAQRDCYSWHGGVAGCDPNGRVICADGTISSSCTCFTSTEKS